MKTTGAGRRKYEGEHGGNISSAMACIDSIESMAASKHQAYRAGGLAKTGESHEKSARIGMKEEGRHQPSLASAAYQQQKAIEGHGNSMPQHSSERTISYGSSIVISMACINIVA